MRYREQYHHLSDALLFVNLVTYPSLIVLTALRFVRFRAVLRAERWSRFLRQGHKVDPTMRTIHNEDAQTVYRRFRGEGRA